MRKSIFQRFHEEVALHQKRIKVVHYFNPGISIYAMAGNNQCPQDVAIYEKIFDNCCEHPSTDGNLRWRNCDFIVRDWYKIVGHKFSFDHIYDHEWDVVLIGRVDNMYSPQHQMNSVLPIAASLLCQTTNGTRQHMHSIGVLKCFSSATCQEGARWSALIISSFCLELYYLVIISDS